METNEMRTATETTNGLQRRTEDGFYLSGNFEPHEYTAWLEPDDTLIERFIIRKRLGCGSFGTVYLAQDTLNSMEVALKVIAIGPFREDIASEQLKDEMNNYRKIYDCRYVVRVFDLHFVPFDGTSLLVLSMEYANGGTFRTWLSEHKNDLETRRTTGMEYFKMACAGVGAVHDAHVTHLDLKPENLLFADNILKISDFGAALFRQSLKRPSNSGGRESSSNAGTPAYMSPEHFSAPHPEDLDHKSDLYSLGVILYELLHPACRPPFGGSYDRIRELHLKVPAPPVPEVDENTAGIIARCLEKNPTDRYQNVWELLEDLEKGHCSLMNSTASRSEVDSQSGQEVKNLWQEASTFFSKGNFNDSLQLTEKVLSLEPENIPAQRLREELRARFEQAERFYLTISQQFQEGDLNELTSLLYEAVSLYPDHPSGRLVQAKLAVRVAEYLEMMEQSILALQKNSWETALEFLQKAIRLHSGNVHLLPLIERLTTLKDLRTKINQALGNSDFNEAIMLAELVDHQVVEIKTGIKIFREELKHENNEYITDE